MLITSDSFERARIRVQGVEFVVSGHPNEPGKARAECIEHPRQVLGLLTHIARNDEPVILMTHQALEGLAVHLVTDVQIAQC